MRGSMVRAGLGAGLTVIAGVASAQTSGAAGAGYPAPGRTVPTAAMPGQSATHPPLPSAPRADGQALAPAVRQSAARARQAWGSKVDGRWWGGANAPGGFAAYRQPQRGYRVPDYWVSPRFRIADPVYYGLPAPIAGYGWTRYYDDAVMIDRSGQVYDYRSGLDWDGDDDSRRSSGIGGAVAGAAVGGVAGNLIAGRGNRLAGTVIGAGVGGAAGYAIDRAHERRGPPPGGYRDDYRDGPPPPPPPPPHDGHDGYRDGHGYPGGPATWVSEDGRTTVTTSTGGYAGSGYGGNGYAGGYPVVSAPYGYAAGGSVTTVTIQSAPVVTTTTTEEVIEDRVTYSRPVVRRVYRHRVYRAKPHVRRRAPCVTGS